MQDFYENLDRSSLQRQDKARARYCTLYDLDMLVHQLRNLWQFSAVCEFVSLFGSALHIVEIDVLKFEQELSDEVEDRPYVREIRLSLLKSLSSNRTVNADNMDDFIRRQYTYRRVVPNPMLRIDRVWKESFPAEELEDPSDSDESHLGEIEEVEQTTLITWLQLSVVQRLGVLHDLCEWQLQSDKFRERIGATTDLQMSQWRILPIGQDSEQQVYYFLSDARLYRCDHPCVYPASTASTKRKRKRSKDEPRSEDHYRESWTCVAAEYDQWQTVVRDLTHKTSFEQDHLLDYLQRIALPYVQEIENVRLDQIARQKAKAEKVEADRIKEMLRQELLSTRKRSSRIAILDEKREEARLRQEEDARAQELERRSRELADRERKDAYTAASRTREARAREREIREYNSNQTEEVKEALVDSVLSTRSASPLEGFEAAPREIKTNKNGPDHQINSNPHHKHNTIEDSENKLVITPQEIAWVDRQANHMTQGIPLEHHALVTPSSTDTGVKTDFHSPKNVEQEMQTSVADAAWVNKLAGQLSQEGPLVQSSASIG